MNSKNFLGPSYISYVTKNTFFMASPTTECYKFLEGRITPPPKKWHTTTLKYEFHNSV